MGELLALILVAIAEVLGDIFLELIGAAVFDFASRILVGLFTGLRDAFKGNRILIGLTYALFGMLTGALSLLVLPHRFIHRVRPVGFHGISLLISPVVVGLVLSYVGTGMRRRGKGVTPLETFGYGYAFAFGMALVRFFFVKR